MENEAPFSINYDMTNTLEWLFYFGYSLASKIKMDAVRHLNDLHCSSRAGDIIFYFFKMADDGHLGFRCQNGLKTL